MNARRVPPPGAPPPYTFVNRIYGRSLRPIVLAFAVMGAIWALAWTVGDWLPVDSYPKLARRLHLSKSYKLIKTVGAYPKLAPLAIVQGVIYSVALAIETFGIYSLLTQRAWMVRMYAFSTAIAGLLVVGVGFMRSITHFTYKGELLDECISVSMNGEVDTAFGIWGSNPNTMDQALATSYCNDEWNHDSWTEILATIFEIILCLLFTSAAFGYYRQVVDPTSPANALRAPSNQARMDLFPPHYNRPYDPEYQPAYAPPLGPPPSDAKPPDYSYAGGEYLGHAYEKDDKKDDDPFSDYEGPSVPRPLHFAEDRG
ncbi:uncharacterized protein HD556DRAFT_1482795 [Suillus plorans]|uniref:Uncharacterized protein n=1 Tax=Suillus plorans TaxID=116603 RepID=A0A9P7DGK7_9AGAM|nr:uncharacterized protein HD556DRAFT_1482795 [Suillus plorans]KAG1792011.1 hypothetical protein HD556DRAFT_1482795 [Suillus plorans]